MAISITQRNMPRQNRNDFGSSFAEQDKRSQLFLWDDLQSEPKPTLFLPPELENCVQGCRSAEGNAQPFRGILFLS